MDVGFLGRQGGFVHGGFLRQTQKGACSRHTSREPRYGRQKAGHLTAARKNDTSAETYGEPQTPADPRSLAQPPISGNGSAWLRRHVVESDGRGHSGRPPRQRQDVLLRDRLPRKIVLLRFAASFRQRFPIGGITQNAPQRTPERFSRLC